MRRVKPPPSGFDETFIRWGWRGVEIVYGSRTTCNRRWIDQHGSNKLKRKRVEYRRRLGHGNADHSNLVRLDHRASHIRCTYGQLVVELSDGRSITAPIDWFPMLAQAKREDQQDYEISDDGSEITWPSLGERVTVLGMLADPFPSRTKKGWLDEC